MTSPNPFAGLDDALAKVPFVAPVGEAAKIQALLRVPVECTKVLAIAFEKHAVDVVAAAGEVNNSLDASSSSADKLATVANRLTIVLALCAVLSLFIAAGALWTARHPPAPAPVSVSLTAPPCALSPASPPAAAPVAPPRSTPPKTRSNRP
jgi:hypothetical protein